MDWVLLAILNGALVISGWPGEATCNDQAKRLVEGHKFQEAKCIHMDHTFDDGRYLKWIVR